MYGSSRIASARERTTRATFGIIGKPIAMTRFTSMPSTMFLPSTATTVIASMMIGNDSSTSMMRWMTRSILPPKYAETTPMIAPIVEPTNDARKPTASAVRAP